jgi:ribosomal protein S18 acetylase RimI-like enzyme
MIKLDRIAADDDPLLVWAAQDMQPGVRAWAHRSAAAVATRDVANRNRVAVRGDAADVDELLLRIRPEVAGFFPISDEALIAQLTSVEIVAGFGWMDTTRRTNRPDELQEIPHDEVNVFLDENHPHSFARPGWPGVKRWVGLRDDDKRLLAVATDAWTTTRTGFISGVATRKDARGQGLATRLCAALTDELLQGRDRVALLVDHDNIAAVRTYERLGYTLRRVAAATFAG